MSSLPLWRKHKSVDIGRIDAIIQLDKDKIALINPSPPTPKLSIFNIDNNEFKQSNVKSFEQLWDNAYAMNNLDSLFMLSGQDNDHSLIKYDLNNKKSKSLIPKIPKKLGSYPCLTMIEDYLHIIDENKGNKAHIIVNSKGGNGHGHVEVEQVKEIDYLHIGDIVATIYSKSANSIFALTKSGKLDDAYNDLDLF